MLFTLLARPFVRDGEIEFPKHESCRVL